MLNNNAPKVSAGKKKLKLTFCSGVTTVTGANFMLETVPEDGETTVKILIDCGMEQGSSDAIFNNKKQFPYNPSSANYLLVTHAHIDHIGLIPKLVRDGFNGKIFSTPETRHLVPVMFDDARKLMDEEALRDGTEPLYGAEDVGKTISLWHEIPYHTNTSLHGGFEVVAKDAGHILGSAMYEISYNGKKIVFTGDLGNSPTPLLKDTEKITDATYLVMESVYGDKNHESTEDRINKLEDVIEDSYKAGGALLIPSFSLEKTQVLLYEINKLMEEGRVPSVPVYLDSPLAIKVTDIYREYTKNFNEVAKQDILDGKDKDIFNFPHLSLVHSSIESKALLEKKNPKIIIAGSGMSTGGRIMHHELNYLPDPKSTILLVGYQSLGTLGRRIQNGDKSVNIFGHPVSVNARVITIDGYSSHKDMDHLVEFVSDTRDTLKTVFPVMGEPRSSIFLAQRLSDYLGVNAYHPNKGESIELEF